MEEIQEIDLCIYENLIFDKNGTLNYCPMVLEQLAMIGKQNLIAIFVFFTEMQSRQSKDIIRNNNSHRYSTRKYQWSINESINVSLCKNDIIKEMLDRFGAQEHFKYYYKNILVNLKCKIMKIRLALFTIL